MGLIAGVFIAGVTGFVTGGLMGALILGGL